MKLVHAYLYLLLVWAPFSLVGQSKPPANQLNVQLKNGNAKKLTITKLDKTSLTWSDRQGRTYNIPYHQIDRIDFKPIEKFVTAQKEYEAGGYKSAALKYLEIYKDKTPKTYYPAPGNFSTLSGIRLLECYRQIVDQKKIAEHFDKVEWTILSEKEYQKKPMFEIWVQAGKENWDAVIEATKLPQQSKDWANLQGSEFAYLRGLAYEAVDDIENAKAKFGEAYGAYPGARTSIAKAAIQKNIEHLNGGSGNEAEIKALVQLYAQLYGDGKLWQGADDSLLVILKEQIASKLTEH